MKKQIIFLCAIVILIIPVFKENVWSKDKKTEKIALIISNRSNGFFKVLENSFLKTAKKLGYKVDVYDSFNDAAKQPNQVKDAIDKKVKAIILNPLNVDASTQAVNEAIAKGIPVLTIDSTIKGAELLAEIATDNRDGGQVAAEWLVKKSGIIPEKITGVIHVKGIDGHTAHIARYAGFNNYLKSNAVGIEWNVLAEDSKRYHELTGNFTQVTARSALENKLGDLNSKGKYIVYCENDVMAAGVIQAIENDKRFNLKNFTIIGFDGSPEGKKFVDKGKMAVTVVQDFIFMGKKTVLILDDYLKKGIKPSNPVIAIPVQMYPQDQEPRK